jgi:hypothetical protein
MSPRALALALLLGLTAPAAADAQDLTIVGLDGAARVLTAADLAKLPRGEVQAPWGDKAHVFQGPRLAYALRAAGVPVGARIHGDPLKAYLVVTGADAFQAVYSLAEVDGDFHEGAAILADTLDGAPLPDKQAPWRLVQTGDRKPWRSVYAVIRIEVRSAVSAPAAPMPAGHAH